MLVLTIHHEEKEQCSKATGHHPLEDINYPLARVSLNLLQDLNLNNRRCSTAAESQNAVTCAGQIDTKMSLRHNNHSYINHYIYTMLK